MDRTAEWDLAVVQACHSQGQSQEQVLSIRSNALLKTRKQPSEFIKVSKAVVQSICDLREFIRLHQKDYLSTSGSRDEKDRIEAEVGLLIKACTQQIEQLKNSVLAAQGSPQAPSASVEALKHQQQSLHQASKGSKPSINAQTAAHLHGVVLHIAELLHQVSSRFDKCRAQRYQQARDQRKPLKGLPQYNGHHTPGSHLLCSAAPNLASPPSQAHASGPGGRGNKQQDVLQKFGASFLGHVREARDALQGADSRSPTGVDQGNARAQGAGGEQKQAQMQQQEQLALENQNLVAQLSATAAQAQGLESTIQDIAVLNQMFSTAVLHQAESIESIYSAAVDASQNISTGNVDLQKAVNYGRSSQRQILIILLAATLGLLFFDWFNS
ncbi:hypothetical protein DUNSADRAFT_1893 [Dunaliella salina]|uniref:SNARE-complex protein Syntaxin-18 N-terminal domain-containing protein n=1 Tax=Dunaliella salina TaxID=3046 RepID=A0ABQ7GWT4_DUNSA|nr:hypothetical protein DUNSADRAFT_1893 [Dunaliella salina]|eukprot:KAF5838947.1 hypothetical protein DUNSADRAFT_1893 [Dunaliella salina]